MGPARCTTICSTPWTGRFARRSPCLTRLRSTAAPTAGYAVLAALTMTPDKFACGLDVVGPSNLETLLASIPPYWKAFYEDLARRVGDPRTEEGRKLLQERSPLTLRRPHPAALADRPGRQRSARQTGRGGSDRHGDEDRRSFRSPTCCTPMKGTGLPGRRTGSRSTQWLKGFSSSALAGRLSRLGRISMAPASPHPTAPISFLAWLRL